MFLFVLTAGDVKCFQDDCYPLAFGVPALLMILAIALFWLGRHKYKRVPQTGNIVWQVMKAITHALKRKITTKVRRIIRALAGRTSDMIDSRPIPLGCGAVLRGHTWVGFRGRAPSWQHSSFGPTSLSCALSNSVSDCEKGRLADHILLLLLLYDEL